MSQVAIDACFPSDKLTATIVQEASRMLDKGWVVEALAGLAISGVQQDALEVVALRNRAAHALPRFHRRAGVLSFDRRRWDRAVYHFTRFKILTGQGTMRLQASRLRLEQDMTRMFESQHERIYIVGCARSGTWMLSGMMRCFEDVHSYLVDEGDFPVFARIDAPQRVHIVKRTSDAFRRLDITPASIKLLFIVRHPLDVLVSAHIDISYYVAPFVWRSWAEALRLFPAAAIVRYEDLVTQPDAEQDRLGRIFGLKPAIPFSRFHENLAMPDDTVVKAMGGLRRPDNASIGRWLRDEHRDYCRAVWPMIADEAQWFCRRFSYEVPGSLGAH